MVWLRSLALAVLGRFGARLRFPALFLVTAVVLVVDVLLPDGLPLLDEIVLTLLTLLFAAWKRDPETEQAAEETGGRE